MAVHGGGGGGGGFGGFGGGGGGGFGGLLGGGGGLPGLDILGLPFMLLQSLLGGEGFGFGGEGREKRRGGTDPSTGDSLTNRTVPLDSGGGDSAAFIDALVKALVGSGGSGQINVQ